ncbi:hypothetical protein HGRIS_008339 [Hohenbuehelia grisea]|uniref:DUF6534 domain-containing protein n=1 Tax=Hohenbuehelia grisea TaxID=104357 RepID=A0ABR3J7N3_9AGAR
MGNMDVTLATLMATDWIIAGSLTVYLNRSRTGIRQTEKTINRIIMLSLNNGIVTSVLDVITLVLAATQKDNLLYGAFFNVLANVYTNTTLATLNSRKAIKATTTTVPSVQLDSTINLRVPASLTLHSISEDKHGASLA